MRIERSFIQVPGIGEKTERSLWESGVTDWRTGVDTSVLGPKSAERVEAFASRAHRELTARNVAFFATGLPAGERWRLYDSFRDRATAMDIETTGLDRERNVVTTVTFTDRRGARTLVRGQDLTRGRLKEVLADTELLLTYNGRQFDVPFLETCFDITIDKPHVDLRYPCRRLGWQGGLKTIERTVGIERKLPAVDGREAIRLWHQHRRGDEDALSRLIRYNREDTRTLFPIADQAVDLLDRRVIAPYL